MLGKSTGRSPMDDFLTLLSIRQYRSMLQDWKLTKNIPGSVMRSAARKLHGNPQRHDFEYKHRAISPVDISRFQNRYPGFDPASSPTACK